MPPFLGCLGRETDGAEAIVDLLLAIVEGEGTERLGGPIVSGVGVDRDELIGNGPLRSADAARVVRRVPGRAAVTAHHDAPVALWRQNDFEDDLRWQDAEQAAARGDVARCFEVGGRQDRVLVDSALVEHRACGHSIGALGHRRAAAAKRDSPRLQRLGAAGVDSVYFRRADSASCAKQPSTEDSAAVALGQSDLGVRASQPHPERHELAGSCLGLAIPINSVPAKSSITELLTIVHFERMPAASAIIHARIAPPSPVDVLRDTGH